MACSSGRSKGSNSIFLRRASTIFAIFEMFTEAQKRPLSDQMPLKLVFYLSEAIIIASNGWRAEIIRVAAKVARNFLARASTMQL